MRCSKARTRIVPWLDGELSPADSEVLEQHVADCKKCSEYMELMGKTNPSKTAPTHEPLPEAHWSSMHQSVMAAFDDHDIQERQRIASAWLPPIPRHQAAAIAYAAILVLALSWGWSNHKAAVEANVARDSALEQLERYQQVVAEQQPLAPLPQLPQVRPAAYVPYRDTF